MESNKSENAEPDAQNPQISTLPEGYLWRLCVVLLLLIGGCVCLIFYSTAIGSLMSLGGLAFGKLSGLNAMIAPAESK